jgi:hypothetical protein
MHTVDYEILLEQYRELWNNRRLESINSAEEVLNEAIGRDLRDENSHPRARRSLMEKYFLASKRIIESSLPNESKLILVQMHIDIAEAIKNG